jgi:hypothetical protein
MQQSEKTIFRVRLGVILYIISWLPFEPLVVIYAHHYHVADGWKLSTIAILILWIIQFTIGIIGIFIVGREVMKESQSYGYKKAVVNLWHIFLHGQEKST